MNGKRILSAAMALLLSASLPVAALAEEYDLAKGSITVSADESGQYVSQLDNNINMEKQTTETVISQSNSDTTATSNTITVSTTGEAQAEVTIKDVNISEVYDKSAIDVGAGNATINVEGQNTIHVDYVHSGSWDEGSTALIHVDSGSLTVTSENGGKLDLENRYSSGAVIGSDGDEDFSGQIHITGNVDLVAGTEDGSSSGAGIGSGENGNFTDSASVLIDGDAKVEARAQDAGAGIGSGESGNMSGTITIGGNAQVDAASDDDGAGIGTGQWGNISGTITIGDNAQVTATSEDDGAGIGTGDKGEMSGTITIDGNAQVNATSHEDGAGIGSGLLGKMTGTIAIDGNAQVKAASYEDGAGIGCGNEYDDVDGEHNAEMSGTIIIGGNAKVTAYCADDGAGIGGGGDALMSGRILIKDKAVIISSSAYGAAIGSHLEKKMTGQILILDQAKITTGEVDQDGNIEPYDGIIGDGYGNWHISKNGVYVFGDGITINGIKGSSIEELKQYVNMYLDGENNDGEVTNLGVLTITQNEDGSYAAEVTGGAGQVEKLLYSSSEAMPTTPGSYPVTVVLKIHGKTVEIEIGTLVVQPTQPAGKDDNVPGEDSSDENPSGKNTSGKNAPDESTSGVTAPLYRVTDLDGKSISCKAVHKDGVLTITVDQDCAILTGKLSGIHALKQQGIEKIVFTTGQAASTFQTEKLLEKGSFGDTYQLTHDGEAISFTLGAAQADISDILE